MRIAKPDIQELLGRMNQPSAPRLRWASGVASLDTVLSGGFAYGHVHEFYAAEAGDMPATAGFALALGTAMVKAGKRSLWLRTYREVQRHGVLQANGWAQLGAEPAHYIFGIIPDANALLKTAVDALRSNALSAVMVEAHGRFSELDIIASRRLALAAEKSGTPLFLIRADAEPSASAAETRWRISSAPSRMLSAQSPGAPVFDIELLRQRSGPSGNRWQLEWNRDRGVFIETTASGTLVSAPFRRSATQAGTEPVRLNQNAA